MSPSAYGYGVKDEKKFWNSKLSLSHCMAWYVSLSVYLALYVCRYALFTDIGKVHLCIVM